jgi:hypothetical protein
MQGMIYLLLLKHWDRGFESYSKHGCLFACSSVLVLSCISSGHTTGLSLVQGVLRAAYTRFLISELILNGNRPKSLIHMPACPTASLSIYVSIYLSIYLWLYNSWLLAHFLISWSLTESARPLGRGISPSEGRYLHTGQHKHKIKAHRPPCLKRDSNPLTQCLSGRRKFMP